MALTSSTTPMLDAAIVHEKRTSGPGIVAGKAPSIQGKDQVRIVTCDEYKEAAACLAEAFQDDHVVRYPGLFDALILPHSAEFDCLPSRYARPHASL